MDQVICPHCGKEVELTQALRHEIEQQITADLKESQDRELAKLRIEIEETTRKKLGEETEFKLKNAANESEELKKRNRELQDQLLEMNKSIRELKEDGERSRLENEKRLNESLEKSRAEIASTVEEKYKLELAERDKKLSDTQKALEEAQRKTKQGSQQLQGEVLELGLEKQLQAAFPDDEILPVPKGITGADIIQKVRNRAGRVAGDLIIETKRARWNQSWIAKLKDDMRTSGSSEAILICEELPEKLQGSGLVNGVWITSYQNAITVISTLRILLMKVAQAKAAAENKDEKLENLYQYITSDSFRHKIESQLESFILEKSDLDSEKRAMEKIWSKREMRLNLQQKNTINIFGELQGIAGSEMPSVKTLDFPETSQEPEELKLLD